MDEAQKIINQNEETSEFDLQTLNQSASLLKDELEIAIDEYLEDAAAYIRDIQNGLDHDDAQMAARGSHTLKSNSRGFGLTAVADISEEINKQTRADHLAPAKEMFPQLQEAFARGEKILREFVKRGKY